MIKSRQQSIQELEWFFWKAESEMGIHSNYSTLFSALLYAMSATEAELVDIQSYSEMARSEASHYSVLAAVSKYREILRRYHQLSSKSKIILEKYYDERQYQDIPMQTFGSGIALIPLTSLGREMTQLQLQYPPSQLVKHFSSIKKGLRKQVNEIFNQAVDEYRNIHMENK